MELLKSYYKTIIACLVCLVGGIFIGYNLDNESNVTNDNILASNIETEDNNLSKIFVDIKGSVKKPGVYEMEKDTIIFDAIKKAGGLKKNAYTKNINLSKTLTNEMVIYVYSKSEINDLKKKNIEVNDVINPTCTTEVIEVNNCPEIVNPTSNITTTKSSSTNKDENRTKLVNINKASKEELMTISGIGASKADAIIAYRSEKAFKSIEDIKNVSGIGDSLYEKVKDYITV